MRDEKNNKKMSKKERNTWFFVLSAIAAIILIVAWIFIASVLQFPATLIVLGVLNIIIFYLLLYGN